MASSDTRPLPGMMTHRYAFKMQLKTGAVDEYRRRHAEIWPELTQLLRAAGIRDYSIFLDEPTLGLFAVLTLAAGHSRDDLPNHPVMKRWWAHMAPLMEVEPDNRPCEWPLVPMFHLD